MAKGKKTGGRVAGTPNKFSKSMKQVILNVFHQIGDEASMAAWAQHPKNQTAFYQGLCGRLVPQQHEGSDDPNAEPILTKVIHEYRDKP